MNDDRRDKNLVVRYDNFKEIVKKSSVIGAKIVLVGSVAGSIFFGLNGAACLISPEFTLLNSVPYFAATGLTTFIAKKASKFGKKAEDTVSDQRVRR